MYKSLVFSNTILNKVTIRTHFFIHGLYQPRISGNVREVHRFANVCGVVGMVAKIK